MNIASIIENAELLTTVYGGWPSFHDASVRELRLMTAETHGEDEPLLEAVIRMHRMTDEVDARGYLVLKDRLEVTLQFFGVCQLELDGFSSQNVLYGLRILDVRDRQLEQVQFEVSFESSAGVDATFGCRRVRVASATPVPR
jgi:hypothetical protein